MVSSSVPSHPTVVRASGRARIRDHSAGISVGDICRWRADGQGRGLPHIDDSLKPDEALSETLRKAVNDWFDHTLYSRLNDKRTGCIVIIMQRLHEDDLVGHVLDQENWVHVRLPAIAEEEETHLIETPFRTRTVRRQIGEPLHPGREPLMVLEHLRRT